MSGFSFSGLPGVVIGHNNAISWGFTNLDPDVRTCTWSRSTATTSSTTTSGAPMATREETFKVAGQDEPVKITVRETRHGPLISDVGDDEREVGELGRQAGASTRRRTASRCSGPH